ncbi:MAG: hypothetical protein ABEK50_00265, partial [bacterium]
TERRTGRKFTNRNIAGGLYYALGDPRGLAMGIGVKIIQQSLHEYSTTNHATDVGLQYRTPSFSIGASVRNKGPDVRFSRNGPADPMPETRSLGLAQGFQFLYVDWLLSVEGTRFVPDRENILAVGLELEPVSFLILRTGIRNAVNVPHQSRSLRAGLGLRLTGLTVDYSFTSRDLFDQQHVFSVTFPFGSR